METVPALMPPQSAMLPAPLRVLLIGKREEDYFLIRETLERTRHSLPAELDHVHSLEEARAMLQQKTYGLILFEHETGEAGAVKLLSGFHQDGVAVPFIMLTEHADEKTVAEIIG